MDYPKMKTEHDCGIVAIAWVIHKITKDNFDTIYRRLFMLLLPYWKNSTNYSGIVLDLLDNPSQHQRLIEGMSHKFSLVEPIKENLFNNHCPSLRTIILIHRTDDNINDVENFIKGTFLQHWVVLNSVTDTHISVFMGNGKDAVYYDKATFEKMIITGIPQCVYVIGDYKNEISTPIYSKVYNIIVRHFVYIYDKFKNLFIT